ncbi:hypothetical protein L345_07972, partial [Ophiophagus hannah]
MAIGIALLIGLVCEKHIKMRQVTCLASTSTFKAMDRMTSSTLVWEKYVSAFVKNSLGRMKAEEF